MLLLHSGHHPVRLRTQGLLYIHMHYIYLLCPPCDAVHYSSGFLQCSVYWHNFHSFFFSFAASHGVADSVWAVSGLLAGDHVLCELCVGGILRLPQSLPGAGDVGHFHFAGCAIVGKYTCSLCCCGFGDHYMLFMLVRCLVSFAASSVAHSLSGMNWHFFATLISHTGGRWLSLGGVFVLRVVGLRAYYSINHDHHGGQYFWWHRCLPQPVSFVSWVYLYVVYWHINM